MAKKTGFEQSNFEQMIITHQNNHFWNVSMAKMTKITTDQKSRNFPKIGNFKN